MAARKTTMDRLQELVRLHRLGTGTRESARLLKMSPNTERKYREALRTAKLYDGPLDALPTLAALREAVDEARSAVPLSQRSGIESWRPMIEKLMDAGLRPKAVRRRLLEQRPDFPGTYAQVKRLAATIRREPAVEVPTSSSGRLPLQRASARRRADSSGSPRMDSLNVAIHSTAPRVHARGSW